MSNACSSHCCILHGCKYMDDNCPVENGIIKQEHPCEDCGSFRELDPEIDEAQKRLIEDLQGYRNLSDKQLAPFYCCDSILDHLAGYESKEKVKILRMCMDYLEN